MLQAEVLDALRKKLATVDPESFVMLVAEDSRNPQQGIVGVIEVTRMTKREVSQRLRSPPEQQYAYISSMAVLNEKRRQGVASALLQAADEFAKWWEEPLALHVYDSNAAAIRCYQAHGYSQEYKDPGWLAAVGGKVKVVMVKPIPS